MSEASLLDLVDILNPFWSHVPSLSMMPASNRSRTSRLLALYTSGMCLLMLSLPVTPRLRRHAVSGLDGIAPNFPFTEPRLALLIRHIFTAGDVHFCSVAIS